ncbi:MAG: O-antigen ligase family protein [Actinomycetota bacterium]|nr:O-antigen ligase family protein [Actinomycetota bacterium]
MTVAVTAPLRARIPVSFVRIANRLGWPAIVPALVAFSVLASVGVADGGLFPRAWRLATLALASIAGAALLARRRLGLGRAEWLVIGALGAFTGWTALSGLWSGELANGFLNAERSLVYPAGMLGALLVVDRWSVAHLLAGVLAGVTLVCAYGLGIYVLTSPPLDPVQGELLFQPLGYANAVGIVATIGILLSLGLALAAWRVSLRLLALAPLAVLAPTLFFAESRGSMLVLALGAVVLLSLSGRLSLRVAAALGTVALLAVVAFAASGTRAFSGELRIQYWKVAWWDYREHLWLGSGAGTFGEYWLRHRPVDVSVRTAHTLYLQALAELGPVGLVLILVAVLTPLAVLRRRRDPVVAAAAAPYLAFVLHAGVDWDWELPAVTLAGFFCGAALLAAGRGAVRPLRPRERFGLLVPLAVIAVLACVRLQTGGGLPFGP